jgi:seryl-tRNA synthetase
MLDPKLLRENPDLIKKACAQKHIKLDIDEIVKLDKQVRELKQQVEKIRAEKKVASDKIAKLKGEEKNTAIKDTKVLSDKEKELNPQLEKAETELGKMLLFLPMPASEETPEGKDDTENKELYKWGKLPEFDFEPLDHIKIAEKCDLIDMPRGAKIAGARSYFLKNEGMRLEMAIIMYALDKLVKKGFTPFIVPTLVNYEAMMGTSYFPGGEEQAYSVGVQKEKDGLIESDNKYLTGTAEVALTSYHYDEILEKDSLPRLYCGLSTCYRREAGTYGKDTHGIYRIHQFQKIEQVVICENNDEESKKMHELILKNSEEVLQELNLPYRVVAVCTGDMGRGQYYKNDIETWMPSRKSYGETHSCSTFHDFQSRRLNLRYRDENGKTQFCHTLNNTCVASPRILIPILEIYQQKDGSVKVPKVLQPYMGGLKTIDPR